ncbi:hypothetical protein ES288_D01G034000v1 [Gossypium darwinii]|uniref:Knottins-like domain-containing protein n=1 Tax=Gossypium darwinii TaxID=34276 RepID=A0A5D2DJN9_GOSDA|nr:hypothetical protein ES288_D01G034000v1 [Gossypium darwinii]
MERFSRSVSTVVLLILILLATVEGGPICKATSKVYKGLCLIDDSCDIVCKREGFHRGNCKGFLRKCVCTNPC